MARRDSDAFWNVTTPRADSACECLSVYYI